jgi:sRNA-binding regulator protein Hfq
MKALKRKSLLVTGFALIALLMVNLLVMVQTVQAAGETKEYVQFNAAIPLADNLMTLKGKTVTVYLSSGQTMTGIVKDVKDHLLHLEKLSQKDFYDAIIRLELISAVEARVR